jgi:2-oxoglutarate ferredoxin oxidoreductase subunit delta
MAKIKIDNNKCKGCYLCIMNCPKGSIEISGEINTKGVKPVEFKEGKCTGCGMCAIICPDCAIIVVK